ncbi:Protein kinase-like domain [Penicillium digitatum]|uniref:Protein kinase-like domain n=1 Tax=Penicillium digitatum TaxID=36651 RepID=A0A7T7BM48_PENDI|nr:Protein kinase-like domain [Penicillium digitatum]
MAELEGFGRRFAHDPLSSEKQLEAYERFGVEEHVHDIISELCKLPAAREEFALRDGIHFSNHKNSMSENKPMEDESEDEANELPSIRQPRPDQFCISRIDGTSTTILTTVEYKPPHKLPSATFRMGLRPMDLWKDVVRSNKVPTDQEEKLKYSATRLVCSAIVQEYHVMIQERLEYSYLTNGLTRVLLRVPRDQPSSFYYFSVILTAK